MALTEKTGAGELITCGTATTKGTTGCDPQRRLVGRKGTLALIVEASLRVTPAPPARRASRAIYREAGTRLMIEADGDDETLPP